MQICLPETYIVLDTETTGYDVYKDEIIEIAAIRVQNNEIIDKFNTLVKPYRKVPKKITEITGITTNMVENAPNIKEVLPNFINFVDNCPIIAHNANFDLFFICRDAKIYGNNFQPEYIDSLELAKGLVHSYNHQLEVLAEYYELPAQEHRALSDCHLLFECLKRMCIIKPKKYDKDIDTSKVKLHVSTTIINETINTNTNAPLFNKKCVITGEFQKISRVELMQKIVENGGICQGNISSKTNLVIAGENAGPSKLQKVKEMNIEIISEDEFFKLINNPV